MGRAHALALAREGCDLVLCDILDGLADGTPYPKATQAELDDTAAQAEALGVRCVAVKADVGDPAAAASLIDRATREFGRLDYLVANAAVTLEGKIQDLPPETFETVIRNNLQGVFNVMSPALRVMTAARRGRIVTIASGAARHAEAEAGPYVASKWGVIGLSKTAALEAAKAGVTVNVILPGPVDTPMMSSEERFRQTVKDKPDPTREDYLEARKDATPMGYAWVKPEDVTAALLFLLSDEARFVSGATLSVDAADSANWP
jgi:NAD(P)-dependent dehydrogenase (short-subunit alcohol dehydrogenase family)